MYHELLVIFICIVFLIVFINIITIRKMKGQFSYMNGRALSHASLQKFRHQNPEPRDPTIKETFVSKPNIKYYSNSNENNNSLAIKGEHKRVQTTKQQEQLKKKIKVLQYELKSKLMQSPSLTKLFKSKNTSQLSHIDIYLEYRKLQQQLQQKQAATKVNTERLQQLSTQLQQLLKIKQQQEQRHTKQITNFLDKLEKLQKKHRVQKEQQDGLIKEQVRKKEEKDYLLREFRIKCEKIQSEIVVLQDQLHAKQDCIKEMQKIYMEKLAKNKQNYQAQIQQANQQLLHLSNQLKQKQQHIIQLQSRQEQSLNKIRQIQNQQNIKSKQKGRVIKQWQEYKKSKEKQIQNLQEQLSNKAFTLAQQAQNYQRSKQKIEQMCSQLQQKNKMLRETEQNVEKNKKNAKIQEQKLQQLCQKCRRLQYQSEQKQLIIKKYKKILQQKESMIEQKAKEQEQFTNKIFLSERKLLNSLEKIKQLQKQIVNLKNSCNRDKKLQYELEHQRQHYSKLQIQNYKCIGRLLQLMHQIRRFNQEELSNNSHKTKKLDKQQQPQTITQCIDMLTKQLDIFIKGKYNLVIESNKSHEQFILSIICDVKSIFHAYNSYIHDEQLKGATRQYLECLENNEKNSKKSRNSYLQVIMQRLISMIAIKSYTSEKGLKRQSQSKTRLSNRKNRDSLQNTTSFAQQNENYKMFNKEKTDRNKTKQSYLEPYPRNKGRSSYGKIITQPNQQLSYVRRLDYTKQNIMQRINRPEPEVSKYNYLSVDPKGGIDRTKDREKNDKYSYYENGTTKEVGILLKMKNLKNQPQFKQSKKQKKDSVSDAQLIEKKYFR